MSYYTTEFDLKWAQDIDTSEFDTIPDLANLKSNVDKWDIAKLKSFQLIWVS